MNEDAKQALGQRLHRLRLQTGITQAKAANAAGVRIATWRLWEQGSRAYHPWRAPDIANALGLPVAQLFTDDPIVAEVRVSSETLERCRNEGREASLQASRRLAELLEPLIWQEATRPAVDVRPGARAAKKRMSKVDRLRGLKAADKAQRAAKRRSIG